MVLVRVGMGHRCVLDWLLRETSTRSSSHFALDSCLGRFGVRFLGRLDLPGVTFDCARNERVSSLSGRAFLDIKRVLAVAEGVL